MANTTTVSGHTITITGLDADWYLSNDLADWATTGLMLVSIIFHPSAQDDIMIIRDVTLTTGAIMFYGEAANAYETNVRYYPGNRRFYPTIDISQCTFTTAAEAYVLMDFN